MRSPIEKSYVFADTWRDDVLPGNEGEDVRPKVSDPKRRVWGIDVLDNPPPIHRDPDPYQTLVIPATDPVPPVPPAGMERAPEAGDTISSTLPKRYTIAPYMRSAFEPYFRLCGLASLRGEAAAVSEEDRKLAREALRRDRTWLAKDEVWDAYDRFKNKAYAVNVDYVKKAYPSLDDGGRLQLMRTMVDKLMQRNKNEFWNGSWIFSKPMEEEVPSEQLGRIYFNLDADQVTDMDAVWHRMDLLSALQQSLKDEGVEIKFKIAESPEKMHRRDPAVLYFKAADQMAVLRAVQAFSHQHRDIFSPGIPLFAAQVLDAQGNDLPGISFGQNPNNGASFGELRATVMIEILNQIDQMLEHGMTFRSEDEVMQLILHLMEAGGVSTRYLALNSDGERLFDEIIRYTDQGV